MLTRVDDAIERASAALLALQCPGGYWQGLVEAAANYPGENQTDARLALVVFYNREGRYDPALNELAKLRDQYPRNRLFWLETGSTYLRAGRFAEARLVDQAEVVPAVVAAVLQTGMRRDRFQQVQGTKARKRQLVPESVVSAGPDQPGVPAFYFFRC